MTSEAVVTVAAVFIAVRPYARTVPVCRDPTSGLNIAKIFGPVVYVRCETEVDS